MEFHHSPWRNNQTIKTWHEEWICFNKSFILSFTHWNCFLNANWENPWWPFPLPMKWISGVYVTAVSGEMFHVIHMCLTGHNMTFPNPYYILILYTRPTSYIYTYQHTLQPLNVTINKSLSLKKKKKYQFWVLLWTLIYTCHALGLLGSFFSYCFLPYVSCFILILTSCLVSHPSLPAACLCDYLPHLDVL